MTEMPSKKAVCQGLTKVLKRSPLKDSVDPKAFFMMLTTNYQVLCHGGGFDLKPIWDAIGESPVRGLDSMSPPPDNDTGVAEALALWPEMRLCINFPSSVHLASPEAVYEKTRRLLAEDGRSGRRKAELNRAASPPRPATSTMGARMSSTWRSRSRRPE